MSELIALMNLLCDIEGVDDALEKKDFGKIDSLIFKDEVVYYKCNLKINSITECTTNNYINYRKDLFRYKEIILEKINKIINTSNYSYCEYALINIISEIQTNTFLENLLSINNKDKFSELIYEEKYIISGLGKSLYEFVNLHEKFKLFKFKKRNIVWKN